MFFLLAFLRIPELITDKIKRIIRDAPIFFAKSGVGGPDIEITLPPFLNILSDFLSVLESWLLMTKS